MSIDLIKQIREKTGLSLKDIKVAVDSMPGASQAEIIEQLRKQGMLKKDSRTDRVANNGKIFSYVHEGRIGVLLEIKCETDFVARSEAFEELGQNLCLHIAAYKPLYVDTSKAPMEYVEKELEIASAQLLSEGKPKEMVEKILSGKKAKILEENSLMNQKFLKNPELSVEEYISTTSAATGEKIEVTRFVIYSLS